MLEKIGRAAEKAAASVPRRQFLGRLGRGAALLAGTLGGILVTASSAEAGPHGCPKGTTPVLLCCFVSGEHCYVPRTSKCMRGYEKLWVCEPS